MTAMAMRIKVAKMGDMARVLLLKLVNIFFLHLLFQICFAESPLDKFLYKLSFVTDNISEIGILILKKAENVILWMAKVEGVLEIHLLFSRLHSPSPSLVVTPKSSSESHCSRI